MGLAGKGHGAAFLYRLQPGHLLAAGRGNTFIPRQGGNRFPVFLIRHLQGQQHISVLERLAILLFQGLLILLITAQRDLVLLGRGYVPSGRTVLRGAGHITFHVRVLVEIAHDPVFGLACAPGSQRVGVVDVRAVGDPVGGDGQHTFGQTGLDFLGGGRHGPGAGGTGLAHGGPADVVKAGHGRQPGQAEKTALLRDCHTQHAVVELLSIQAPVGQELPGDVGGEFHAVQVGEATLPLGKRGGPVSAVGNGGFHHDQLISRM